MVRLSPGRLLTAALYVVALVPLALAATWLSVRITPLQTVSAAGQTLRVGAALPRFSLSGPGGLDLFGQKIPTEPRFDGPLRPRLDLAHISPGPHVDRLLESGDHGKPELAGRRLADGWVRYALWETAVAAGVMSVRSRLASLNSVLRDGARTAGAVFVRPRFAGHELCSSQPHVQGPADKAPLHPTAAGELAIALADQQALP
ncbi:SGNH/GDSL hydrolase family protein [Streptomyces beihaiensis]|uniref:Uncharacterized protein n=1 Tax=Streptomyces beihaiensis TaxID=2984495 RepID=A0ABT3TMN9_9ACTN|nr:hypothetical protein [Streptomyces beihaiensis]MCX3058314.1 hypothetical protein [Streptomyces beihaiensis]